MAVSRWTIYQLIWNNEVASVQVGRCRRIVRKSFEGLHGTTHRGVGVMAERKRRKRNANGQGGVYQRTDGRWEAKIFVDAPMADASGSASMGIHSRRR